MKKFKLNIRKKIFPKPYILIILNVICTKYTRNENNRGAEWGGGGGGGGAEQIEGGTELIKVEFIRGGTSTVEKQGVRIIYRKRDNFYVLICKAY